MTEKCKNMGKEEFGVKVCIVGNRCSRCGYEWVPHDFEEIPETCPSCRSPYWNKKKVRFKKEENKNIKERKNGH